MTKYSIPPNVAAILMLAYSSLGLLSVPVLQALGFTTNAATIYAWATLLGGVLGIAMHLFSSTAPGVLAPQDNTQQASIPAVKVTLFLALCLMAGAMIPGHAHADPLKHHHRVHSVIFNGRIDSLDGFTASVPLPIDPLHLTSKATKATTAVQSIGNIIPNVATVLTNIFNQGTTKLLADMASADSIAGGVDPNSPNPAPYNLYEYDAHMCISAASPWIAGASASPAVVPKPTGDGGLLTDLVQAEVSVSTAQEFINKLIGNGIPIAVRFNCGAWVMQIQQTPASVTANAQSDFATLMTAIFKQ